MTTATKHWTEDLKQGDRVGLIAHNGVTRKELTVDRITPSGQIVAEGWRFRKDKHSDFVFEIGVDRYFRDRIVTISEYEELKSVEAAAKERRRKIEALQNYRYGYLTDEQLDQVWALLGRFSA